MRALALGLLCLSVVPSCAPVEEEDEALLGDSFAEDGKADAIGARRFAVTATSVERLGGSLALVSPPVRSADPGHSPSFYLQPGSALGPAGPLGAWGPLGALGPIGDNSWNASAWKSGAGDFAAPDGPLSEDGPLGPGGPLSRRAYGEALPAINDFAKQLQAGGVWTALGPLGPLGALGPLGPLGPLGAHGFARGADGVYRKAGAPVRLVRVPYEGRYRTYELFEQYPEAVARDLVDNDTSFLVTGTIRGETDSFSFTSRVAQYVTLVLLPENSLSDFDLEIVDGRGRSLAASRSDGRQTLLGALPVNLGRYLDFVQLPVGRGARITARISARSTNPFLPSYRLFVVGSTGYVPPSDISGPHQAALP